MTKRVPAQRRAAQGWAERGAGVIRRRCPAEGSATGSWAWSSGGLCLPLGAPGGPQLLPAGHAMGVSGREPGCQPDRFLA